MENIYNFLLQHHVYMKTRYYLNAIPLQPDQLPELRVPDQGTQRSRVLEGDPGPALKA